MKSHWILGAIIVLLMLLLGGIYSFGYRVGPNLSIVKTHTLTIMGLLPGTQVFADLTPRGTATAATMSMELIPGNHTILANVDGYQPWEGIVMVPEDADASVDAFLIPKTVTPKELLGADATSAMKLIASAQLPDASTALSFLNDCAKVFVSNNRVLAEASMSPTCAPVPYLSASEGSSTPTIIYAPIETLHSVVPYPGRIDALIVTAGTQIYAIALDPRSPRAFAPLVSGVAPALIEQVDGTLLISDAGHVYSLTLATSTPSE